MNDSTLTEILVMMDDPCFERSTSLWVMLWLDLFAREKRDSLSFRS